MQKQKCPAKKYIKEKGLRHTKDRHGMVEYFQEKRAWTARQLVQNFKHTSRSTIYRNIQTLLDAGLITELHVHDGETYYEWADTNHHDHVACTNCDVIECIDCPAPNLRDHYLELKNLCSTCK